MADDATSKIKSGLAKGEGYTSKKTSTSTPNGNALPLSHLKGLRGDRAAIQAQISSIKNAAAFVEQMREGYAKHVADEVAKIRQRYEREGFVTEDAPNGRGTIRSDVLGADKRRVLIQQAENKARKNAAAFNEDKLRQPVAELRASRDRLKWIRENYTDATSYLLRSTLADPARATYQANLAASGPTEIEQAARHAVQTKDKALAAAVCCAIEALPKDTRKLVRVSRNSLAADMVGEEVKEAQTQIRVGELFCDLAERGVREAVGQTIRPEEKIRFEKDLKELSEWSGKTVDELLAGQANA